MTSLQLQLASNSRRQFREAVVKVLLFLCALLSVLTTLSVVTVLASEAWPFFLEVSPLEFLFGTVWQPQFAPESFGVLPLICGTFLVVIGASLIAIPIGLTSAIYLSEYASARARSILKPTLELLAGIPTVVYGYFALTMVTPFLQWLHGSVEIYNALSASIVVGIMILPTVASLCDDALRAVPSSLRQAAFALGATPMEVSLRVVLPAALSGVIASFVLAISRAIGETMAVAMAAGATPRLTLDFRESIQTMTAYMASISMGDLEFGSTSYRTIFAVGGLLFVITLAINLLAERILRRFREIYE